MSTSPRKRGEVKGARRVLRPRFRAILSSLETDLSENSAYMFAVCSEALVFAVRLPVLILLLGLSAVIPASAEGRDTICLYAASVNVCTDLAERTNERDRRISLFGDAKVQRVCRSRLWLQFYRECTERFRSSRRTTAAATAS